MPPPMKVKMEVSPFIVDPAMPSDPAVSAVADDVLAKLRRSFTAVAAEEQPGAHGSADDMFRAFLATRGAPTRTRYRERSRALLNSPSSLQTSWFGRYAAVNSKAYQSVGSDDLPSLVGPISKVVAPVAFQKAILQAADHTFQVPKEILQNTPALKELKEQKEQAAKSGTLLDFHFSPEQVKQMQDNIAGAAYTKMQLGYRKVSCIEETSGSSNDEIYMGGNFIDPHGNTSLVSEFKVSDDFDEGEVVDWQWYKPFATWDIVRKPVENFPYTYMAVIAMAEKDDGGFYKFLKALWEKVRAEVIEKVGALVGKALSAKLGALGGVIGTIVGAIVGKLIDWIVSLFNNPDDLVGIKTLVMSLGWFSKSYYDWARLTAPNGRQGTLVYKGDGGRYDVDIAWKVVT